MKTRKSLSKAVGISMVVLGGLFPLQEASAAGLLPIDIWNGHVGLSVDAVGSNSPAFVGSIQATIPAGATVEAAYLYSAGTPYPWYSNSPRTAADYNGAGVTVAGNPIDTYDTIVGAVSDRADIGRWYTGRANVTPLISSLATAGPDYSWIVTEGASLNNRIDGELLAIVYSHPSLPVGSVALLDGGQRTGGETTFVSFVSPLSGVGDPAFFAEMSLGISFSTGISQVSTIDINGVRISSAAGGYDDGVLADGGLITGGGVGDTNANPAAPGSSSSPDDERYDLKPFLSDGDTGFDIFTRNASNDDNIFFMGLYVARELGSVTPEPKPVPDVPEPSTLLLLGSGLVGLIGYGRRRAAKA